MPTIAEQLTQLQKDREDLVDNLETMGISGLSGDETFTELVPEVLNISGGADLDDYFVNTIGGTMTTNMSRASDLIKKVPTPTTINSCLDYMFYYCTNLEELPTMNTANVTTMRNFACGCRKITSVPSYNTANCSNFSTAFSGCTLLRDVPVLSFASVANLNSMFGNCPNLTDTSLDNILQSCITAPSSISNKNLAYLGIDGNTYTASKIQALPHYNDFISAGWTIS